MIAIIIDDDIKSANALHEALFESPAITEVHTFTSCSIARQWLLDYTADLIFMETIVENSSTVSVAEEIIKTHPNCKLIFCTAHPYFALDAFRIHASGYLLKPISAQSLHTEINYICGYISPYLLQAQCFGNFEVHAQGTPLKFKRGKTKELLALLIDRNGAGMTSKQICTYLWESDQSKQINYLYQLFDDLRHTLKRANAEAILVKTGNSYAVNPSLIDCDYYSYLKTARPHFYGEYMTQYSWAETSCAMLWQNMELERNIG